MVSLFKQTVLLSLEMLLALGPSSDMAMASDKNSAFRVVVVVRTGVVFNYRDLLSW